MFVTLAHLSTKIYSNTLYTVLSYLKSRDFSTVYVCIYVRLDNSSSYPEIKSEPKQNSFFIYLSRSKRGGDRKKERKPLRLNKNSILCHILSSSLLCSCMYIHTVHHCTYVYSCLHFLSFFLSLLDGD